MKLPVHLRQAFTLLLLSMLFSFLYLLLEARQEAITLEDVKTEQPIQAAA